MTEMMCNKC